MSYRSLTNRPAVSVPALLCLTLLITGCGLTGNQDLAQQDDETIQLASSVLRQKRRPMMPRYGRPPIPPGRSRSKPWDAICRRMTTAFLPSHSGMPIQGHALSTC